MGVLNIVSCVYVNTGESDIRYYVMPKLCPAAALTQFFPRPKTNTIDRQTAPKVLSSHCYLRFITPSQWSHAFLTHFCNELLPSLLVINDECKKVMYFHGRKVQNPEYKS